MQSEYNAFNLRHAMRKGAQLMAITKEKQERCLTFETLVSTLTPPTEISAKG
jgi:hypothetical protein